MKYEDLENVAKEGRLFVNKYTRENTRRKFIWDRNWKKILETKTFKYKINRYSAQTANMENEWWKITKRDYNNLLLAGAKIKL